jgi:hypothetical protein
MVMSMLNMQYREVRFWKNGGFTVSVVSGWKTGWKVKFWKS